jgi:hypothetical protein
MAILRIEHPVPDFDGWKRAFVGFRRAPEGHPKSAPAA